LKQGDAAAAQRLAEAARSSFQEAQHVEGGAHAERVLGMALVGLGRYAEAEQVLQRSAACFDEIGEPAEAARSLMEVAQARRDRGASPGIVAEALLAALERAEGCRDEALSRELAGRLAQVDEAEHCRWAYRRVRGRGIGGEMLSLLSGQAEMASVLFLDLKDFSQYVRAEDPAIVIATLNQAFHELTAALAVHDVVINQYLGDGFMALSRGAGHARRAVAAALAALATMETYNRPRRLMKLPELIARIGIGTGPLVLGNVGTLRKIDFTAVGLATNLAARLQAEALPGMVCISQATHELVQEDFQFAAGNPRTVQPKNFQAQQVWDVVR
jgi:class 3 adenylate cyclase